MAEDITITATDLEDFDEVDVVEVLVAEGDIITANQSIVTLESDKAMMEFPSPQAGVIKEVAVSVGDKIKQGDALVTITQNNPAAKKDTQAPAATQPPAQDKPAAPAHKAEPKPKKKQKTNTAQVEGDKAYASPAIRKYAGELGVNLGEVAGSASKGRVIKEDVQQFVKQNLSSGNSVNKNHGQAKLPDFSAFGPIEETPLNKLKQVSAQHLVHAWQTAPHVTQFDDADITELESARKQLKSQIEASGAKLTMLPFIMKALVKTMVEYPDFNSSVNASVTALIRKKYFHIGIAVDTPRGLVVPVIRDVDSKKIPVLAKELMQISERARTGKLSPKDMQGGCMSISSIGGIGGQHFTPIINYPEVAILGVSRTQKKLLKKNDKIVERLMLPLSLSYDHRAIDGVAAVKFITSLKNRLSDVWSLML